MTKSVAERSGTLVAHLRTHLYLLTLPLGLTLLAALTSCTDEGTLGQSLQPDQDAINVYYDTVSVFSETVVVDSMLSRSSAAYLGEFTDPFFGTTACDFLAQLYCPYDQAFPDDVTKIDSAFLYMYYDSWYGDSTTLMHVSVYELDQPLKQGIPYYTNHDVKPYIQQARILGKTSFTAGDMYSTDSMKRLDSYKTVLKVPIDVNLGNRFLRDSRDPAKAAFFKTPEAFTRYFNGLFVDCDFGNGSITYVNHTELELCYGTTLESSTMDGVRDSFVLGASYFPITKEVRQVNRFSHPDLRNYVDPFNPADSLNYVFSPAGLYTRITLPTRLFSDLNGKAINAMTLTISATQLDETTYGMAPPSTMLLIRESDAADFFTRFENSDELYSFLADYNSTNESYDFNLSFYAQKMVRALADSTSTTFEPYTNLLLIPVTVVTSNDGDEVRIEQLLTPSAVKIKGWNHPTSSMKLELVYSKGKVN